jgi:hypothetical protein
MTSFVKAGVSGEVNNGVLGLLAERLGSLRAVDAVVLPYQWASL